MAPEAYSSVTGNDLAAEDSDLSGSPSGTPIELDDPRALARRASASRERVTRVLYDVCTG